MSYQCSTCGERHDDLPDVGSDRPDHWWGIPAEERGRRIELTADTCVIDGKDFFIRGVIQLPIHGRASPLGLGVWVSQKKDNFLEYVKNPNSAEIGPFFGWLCTRVSFYQEETLCLKTMAHYQGGGLRPFIELEPNDNRLAIDQREGIDLARAWEIAHFYMHRAQQTEPDVPHSKDPGDRPHD